TEPSSAVAASVTSSTDVSCNGGSDGAATAAGSGGTSPYSYTWSNAATGATATGLAAGTYTVTVEDDNGCTDTDQITITEPTAVTASITSSTNASCNGASDGAATASGGGGTSPYTYAWSTGSSSATITGLAAGTYTVTVEDDNSCTETETVTITEPTAVSASITSSTNASCNGASDGSATASGSGGTSPYTYAWSNAATGATATGLAAGTYTVTVEDDNGCADTETVTITEPSSMTATITSSTNVNCNGGSDGAATAAGSGGTSPYTYSWSSGGSSSTETGLAAGTYTVTVEDDNGCTDTDQVTITEPSSAVAASVTSSTDVSCNGGSDGAATAAGSGGTSPYTYAWSNAATGATATGLAAGTYTVTVEDDNGCTDTDQVTITEPTAVTASITSSTNASCNGASDGAATASGGGGTSPYTYSWSTGSSSATITGLAAGTYTVTVEDDNSCTDTETVTITEPTAVTASITSSTNASCNGASDGSATASGSGGTSPYTYAWSNAATGATATGLAAGTYTVTVEDDNGCADTETVTITEPATLVASVSSSTNASCNGACDGTATATATGGTTAYSYSWSNGGSSATTTGLCAGTFTVTVEDDNGCIDTETVTITAPTTMNASASVDTSASCSGSSDGVATANGSGGSIPYSYNWSNGDSTATATGLTSGTHTVTVTDNNGCTDTAMVNMGTLDTVGPTQITHAFQTYYLDSTGSVIIAVANVDSASTDVCGIDTMYLSQYSFDCGDVGVNSVTFTAEDEAGNVSSITVPISIIDSQPPVVLANWMISVHLDSAGMVTINADTVDSASYDNCGIQSMWLSDSVFSCADTATLNVVTLYVQDGSGNVDSTTCNILVIDSMPPSVIPHNTITYHLDSTGNVAFDRDTVDSATYDNCGIAARYLSDSIFSCSDTGTINYVTLYARDRSGNVDSAIVEVIIVDSQPPSVVAHSWILVHLDSTGMVVFDRDTVDSATSDNCSISARWLSDSNFTCADTGWNTITFYARDRSGNVDSMLAEVFIVDTMPPFVTGSGDTLYLDANGMAVIDTAAMNISVYDNCQVDWVQFTIDTFYCADVGTNNWQVVASDVSGNVDSLNLSIVVADTFAPTVNAQNISVYLDSFGMATVDTTMVNAGAYDNCGIDSMWLAQQNFNCADTTGGTINWLYAVDGNGNVDSASFVISVIDTIAPNLVAQNDTIYLDSSGVTSIDTSLISSAFDNCGLDTLYFSQSSFTCADSGVNSITVTAIDESGNQTDVQIIVTVLDTIAPFVNSYSSITVYVNSTGVAYLNTAMFDDGSNDNCQIDSLSISMDSLTCSSANPTVITLTGIDVSGNSASDTTIVTIVDTTLNVSLTIVEDSVCQGAMVALDSVSTSGGVYSGMGISGDTLYTDTLLGWQYITYTVTNSSGCSDFAVDSVFITGNPTVSVDPGSFVLCAGEMMTLNFASPLGGIYVSQFADSNMLTAPDSAYSGIGGYYTFSNSCGTDTGEFYLQVIPAPEIDLGPDTSLCNAYQLTFDAGTHTSYLWSTGATSQMITINDGEEPLTEDQTIWVTVTNEEGCTNSDTLFVDVMDQPTFYLGDNFTICRDSAVVLTVPNVYDSFIWSDSNTGITILAHDGSAIIPGLYTFWATGTNAGGCSYSDTIVINLKDCSPEGLEAVHLPEGIDVYPNPTASELNIALLQGSVDHIDQIRMVDIRGSQAALFNPSDWSLTSSGEYVMINVSNLANGVYVLQVVHDQGVHSERVIIER
ncbi:MAG: T9SS type A sorting domain-containing protein, partial [Flavobacteriales bacterium]|nr:T9SS type A sorting domain-containing protein [Flavobacteriales bacterium]